MNNKIMDRFKTGTARRPGAILTFLVIWAIVTAASVSADDLLSKFEDRVTEHVLENGWTFLIVERPVAPVFSFATFVNVGSAQEVPGITGIAHMFEHMAFKGTPRIGTTDYEAEKKAIEAVDKAYHAYDQARRAANPDPDRVAKLLEEFKAKQEEAFQHVVPNEFGEIIEREGGVGLNASTSRDFTMYMYSLPANKLELFAYLESERFLHPVFREFYRERDVVQEERRLRTDSQPIGRLFEQSIAAGYVAHPYRQPTIGYMSDLQSITVDDAEAFYRTYYVPSNMVTTIVGHVDPETVIPVLEKYFGRIPKGPKPPELRTVEPPQIAEKTVVIVDPAQPVYTEMFHKPSATHPDDAVYAAIDDVLSNGRTSRLYRSLVRDSKIAAFAGSFSSFPGSKYPNLWLAYIIPAKGQTNEDIQTAVRAEIDRLKTEPISDAELRRFKTRAKADFLRQLRSNMGLAMQFSSAKTLFGDWRALFRSLEAIDRVTKDDIQRVAQETFVPSNRTVAMIYTEDPNQNADGADNSNDGNTGSASGAP